MTSPAILPIVIPETYSKKRQLRQLLLPTNFCNRKQCHYKQDRRNDYVCPFIHFLTSSFYIAALLVQAEFSYFAGPFLFLRRPASFRERFCLLLDYWYSVP